MKIVKSIETGQILFEIEAYPKSYWVDIETGVEILNLDTVEGCQDYKVIDRTFDEIFYVLEKEAKAEILAYPLSPEEKKKLEEFYKELKKDMKRG